MSSRKAKIVLANFSVDNPTSDEWWCEREALSVLWMMGQIWIGWWGIFQVFPHCLKYLWCFSFRMRFFFKSAYTGLCMSLQPYQATRSRPAPMSPHPILCWTTRYMAFGSWQCIACRICFCVCADNIIIIFGEINKLTIIIIIFLLA